MIELLWHLNVLFGQRAGLLHVERIMDLCRLFLPPVHQSGSVWNHDYDPSTGCRTRHCTWPD